MTSSIVDGLVADYLRRLEAALSRLPAARRGALVAEIAEHLSEARAQLDGADEIAVRELLDRMGRPEDIAAEAVSGQVPRRGRGRGRMAVLGAAAVLVVASVVTALVVARPGRSSNEAAGAPAAPVTSARHATPPSAPVSISVSAPPTTTAPVTTTTTPPVRNLAAKSSAGVLVSAPPIPSGIYVNGVAGTPHYYVSLTNGTGGKVSGDVDFLFQDGQTEVAFTFTGSIHNGTMTIYPANVQNDPRITGDVPSAISAVLGHNAFGLGECTGYLTGTESLAECQFNYSPGN